MAGLSGTRVDLLAELRARLAPEFDADYYLEQVPELRDGSIDLIAHYLLVGWRELRDPSPQFSTSYYLVTHPDVREEGINPLLHYVEYGRLEGRSTRSVVAGTQSALVFDTAHLEGKKPSHDLRGPSKDIVMTTARADAVGDRIRENNTLFTPELVDALRDPLIFDLEFYRHTHGVVGNEVDVVVDFLANPMRQATPYFDPVWYLEQYPEAGPAGSAPLYHYLTVGRRNGFRPSPIFDGDQITVPPEEIYTLIEQSALFDPVWYTYKNGDVARAKIDPLEHYSRVGHREYKREPNVLFDNIFYISQSQDVVKYKWHPLVHYILLGTRKALSTHPLLDVKWFERVSENNKRAGPLLARLINGGSSPHIGPNEFFDTQYYLEIHPESKDYPGGVIGHFMEIGWKNGFEPSKQFSTADYARANPDVRRNGTNPFLHFMTFGRKEGRDPKPLPTGIPVAFDRFGEPEYGAVGPSIRFDADVELPSNFALSVAVHLHLYYTEMADEFCGYLSNIPVPFDLFVSIPRDRGDRDKIGAIFSEGISNCSCVKVVATENRGRDVAPFVVEIGQELLDYDLVLHVHSKRSAHSAKHADWRRYLLHYTLGNRSVVTQILTAFHADPKIGVFQPPYHPEVQAQPKWGGNRDAVSMLLLRFGLSYVGDVCTEFPAGSFFWARTDALRPLLSGRLQTEDFEEEVGQTDSTLAHALERLFGIVPILRGYTVACRFIDIAHNLINYYGKSRVFFGFDRDRTEEIIAYQNALLARRGNRGRIAVVTAIIGPFDPLLLPYHLEPNIDYFCVSDSVKDGYGVFRILPPPYTDRDARRSARYVKTNLLRLFPGYEIVVWVDANVLIRATVSEFVAATEGSGCCLGVIPHPTRRSYVEEAAMTIDMKLDDTELIKDQISFYEGVDGLRQTSLIETNFMVFDARKPETMRFAQLWWNEINNHSLRDQLSVNYCLLKAKASWHPILSEYLSARDSPSFSLFRHGLNEWGPKPHIYSAWHKPNIHDGHLLPLPNFHRWTKHAGSLDLDVVICVHNALDEVRVCLASVEAALEGRGTLIIVDDASEAETKQFLTNYAAANGAVLVRKDVQSGYTKAANSGIRAGTNRNVLLLNSDTVVPPGALDKLSDALDCDALLGIVGPLSNAASHQSVPSTIGTASQTAINELPRGMSAADMDRFFERRWDGVIIRTPLVHGFCFCVKRAVFAQIGLFDEDNFPLGYGEESDFCFRAADAGFDLGVLTSTYVFHAKSKSYGEEMRARLVSAGMAALVRKTTKARVSRAVETMKTQPGLAAAREAVASFFDVPAGTPATVRDQRPRLFLLPSRRADGLPAGSGYVRVMLPYRTDAVCREWEVRELRTAKLPPLSPTDTVLVQREVGIIDSGAIKDWIAGVRQSRARLVYEIDDDLFNGTALLDRGFRGDTSDVANRVLAFARAADCVTVSSDALKKKFATTNSNTFLVPNALDMDLWRLADAEPPALINSDATPSDSRVIIGYVGTPTHDQDLALIRKVIQELQDQFPGRIHFQSIGGFGQHKENFGSVISLPPASDYPNFVRWLRSNVRWDVGVIPLVDSSFNRNKSYLKYLECGALGMALVCSKGLEYSKIVRHGETGLLVSNLKKDWTSALSDLIRRPRERRHLARAAYEHVRNHHSLIQLAPLLLQIVSHSQAGGAHG